MYSISLILKPWVVAADGHCTCAAQNVEHIMTVGVLFKRQ